MDKMFLENHRCKCGKLLLKGLFFDGILEIKCKRCGEIYKIGRNKFIDDDRHYQLIVDEQGKIINASESACHTLGYTYEELIGKNFTEINPTMPKEVYKKLFSKEKSALSEDNCFLLDTTHQSKNRKKIAVSIILRIIRIGNHKRHLLTSAIVKNSAGNNKLLIKNKSVFLNNACDFYFELDKNGMMLSVNSTVYKLFGLSKEIYIGKNYFDYLPVETIIKNKKTFEYFSGREQPYRVIHDMMLNPGRKSTKSELFFTPRFDNLGKLVGYCVLGWVIKKPKTKISKMNYFSLLGLALWESLWAYAHWVG